MRRPGSVLAAIAAMCALTLGVAPGCRRKSPAAHPMGSPLKSPGARPPVLKLVLKPAGGAGPAPLDTMIDACGTAQPDGAALSFSFDFGDGQRKAADYCEQGHLYMHPGAYTGQVCVSDGPHVVCEPFTFTARP